MILFLPAAGHIIAGDFGGADAEGFIQTSVTDTDLKSSFVRFSQSVFNTPWSRNRESSMSVRLATVVSELAGRCRFCSCLLRVSEKALVFPKMVLWVHFGRSLRIVISNPTV